MLCLLDTINKIIWGIPVLGLVLLLGIILSIATGFAQIRLIPDAFHTLYQSIKYRKGSRDGTSGYRALCTALAATVGTGNIAGVAGAIALGGPGVLFWMWVCSLLGMVIKLAEVLLSVKYREMNSAGEYLGGPMFIIKNGLPSRFGFLAVIYSFLGIVASLGVGNATQVNTVASGTVAVAKMMGMSIGPAGRMLIGGLIAVIVLSVFCRGSRTVGKWTEKLIPIAAAAYILLSVFAIIARLRTVPTVFCEIFKGALRPEAVTCGTIGSALVTLRTGLSRGMFTNEAGMGTASIAHCATCSEKPREQGLLGIIEVFLDTIVICTLTGLVILCSGVSIPYGTDTGIDLTMSAFSSVLGNWSSMMLIVLCSLFAFATILGWGIYGARCAQYLFGMNAWKYFVILQAFAAAIGTVLDTSIVWIFAEITNGLMAIPNLFAIILLIPQFLMEVSMIKTQSVQS